MDLDADLHGRTICTSMIKVIADKMKSDVSAQIVQNKSKISLIVDESISVLKKLCLILNVGAQVENAGSPQNIFVQLVELSDQGAKAICDTTCI